MEPPPCKQLKLSGNTSSCSSDFFDFSVQLHCTKTGLVDKGEFKLESPPEDVLEVKKQVERQFSIPVCVQTVSFNGEPLKDNIKLSDLKVRNGDTFHVKYLAEGDCADLMNTITWLRQLSCAMASGSSDADLIDVAEIGIQQDLLINLEEFFSLYNDPTSRTYVNKLFFADNDGVSVILKVYDFLLQKTWNKLDERLKYLECFIIGSLWWFADTLPLCRLLIQHNVIQMVTKSLLRVRLEEGRSIVEFDASGDPDQLDLLKETIYKCIEFFLNFTDLSECRLEIASSKDILHQVSCASVAPDFDSMSSQEVALLFSNLAFTPEAHQYIADSVYVGRLLYACEKHKLLEPENVLLEYFTSLFLMQVCLISPQYIDSDQYGDITRKIESFLLSYSYDEIREAECSNLYRCSIFMPYVKLAYIPNSPQAEGTSVGKLQLVSLQLTIFSLQNWLGLENHREVLLKEGLLDFVICMPQYVPPSLRPQTEELVQMVVSSPDIPEGPPKLLNLVKARLAKMYFGLEEILSLSVGEIVASKL